LILLLSLVSTLVVLFLVVLVSAVSMCGDSLVVDYLVLENLGVDCVVDCLSVLLSPTGARPLPESVSAALVHLFAHQEGPLQLDWSYFPTVEGFGDFIEGAVGGAPFASRFHSAGHLCHVGSEKRGPIPAARDGGGSGTGRGDV
jgi:hypothetical protein